MQSISDTLFMFSYDIHNILSIIDISSNITILKRLVVYSTDRKLLNDTNISSKMNSSINISYGGNLILFFNHNDIWYYINNKNFMASDFAIPVTLSKMVTLTTQLDPTNYYMFSYNNNDLIHHNIHNSYPEFILYEIRRKYTFELLDDDIYHNSQLYAPKIYFSCIDEMDVYIENLSKRCFTNKKMFNDGIMIRIYNTLNTHYINVQSECYQIITSLKPLHKNINIGFLEMYQKNTLLSFLPFYSNYSVDILHRINMSIKTLSHDILNIYHASRKNIDLIIELPLCFQEVINNIHKIYLSNKRKLTENSSINVHHIYYYLKEISFTLLLQLFMSRHEMLNIELFDSYLNKKCIYIRTQTMLMLS